MRWRTELAQCSCDIIDRQGKLNVAPDALSRAYCASTSENKLYAIHADLCHSGIRRMYHFIRTKNLLYSWKDVKIMRKNCRICCEIKPRLFEPPQAQLMKSTQPFERIGIDFKGPLPSTSQNHYFLRIVDEYSRFPFVYPCADTSSKTVISCLKSFF